VSLVAPRIRIKRLHVGTQQPVVVYKGDQHRSMQIEVRNGSVVETIVQVAAEIGAGLIAMPTEGTHGLSDALLGTRPNGCCERHLVQCLRCRCRAIHCSRATLWELR
jgi:hypothetical protein